MVVRLACLVGAQFKTGSRVLALLFYKVKRDQPISCFTTVFFYHIKENAQFLH